MTDARITAYAERSAAHASARDAHSRRSLLISRLRLASVLPGLVLLVWGLTHAGSRVPLIAGIVLLAAFAALVVWHARVDERVAWADARRLVNMRAIARLSRDWHQLPGGEPPPPFDAEALERHPYAIDLDLFGHASLFQWLGPAATTGGATTLASWLLVPAEREAVAARQQAVAEVAARQQAVAEAAALDEWREQFAAHGVLVAPVTHGQLEQFLRWAESPAAILRGGAVLQGAAIALTVVIWTSMALTALGFLPGAAWVITTIPGVILSFSLSRAIHAAFDRAGVGQRALARYAELFAHSAGPRFASPRLLDLQSRLSAGGHPAHICMRRLNRILGFAELRNGAAILHFPIQALTLWDFHVAFALERWRRVAGTRVGGWIEALAELDAIVALARVRHDYPGWAVPELDQGRVLAARDIAHPLIADDRRIANDVEIGPPGTLLLVTGSNMSGKSTLLRAVGVNAVLASAGSCVCAAGMRLPAVDLQTSIRVHDSLERGLSYFMAALARLKAVVDSAEHERPGRVLLYLLDEILQGTNSVERSIAVLAVARHLLDAGAIGAMTTHDLSLADSEPLKTAARFVHFTETVDDTGNMTFDYRLRTGVATSSNALRLMKLIGIEV